MALTACEDCGHMVSDLAFACPQCARPIAALAKARRRAAASTHAVKEPRGAPGGDPESVPTPQPEVAAQSVVAEWLGGVRKGRELPAGSKVCKRCGADVAIDTFRKKVGDGYLCSDCVDDELARHEARRAFLSRLLVAVTFVVLAAALTVVAIQVAPTLMAPHGARPK